MKDCIAWNSFPAHIFDALFRKDPLVASLFRNFLLAQRVMGFLNCRPLSFPRLPSTVEHPLWRCWDLELEEFLSQIFGYQTNPINKTTKFENYYKNSNFFIDQLKAFEIWLKCENETQKPEQLTIILQVLLSPTHRIKALELLDVFLEKGDWAIKESIEIGVFPFLLKLLKSNSQSLRVVLISIWSKLVSYHKDFSKELIKGGYYNYFVISFSQPSSIKEKVTSAFILSIILENNPEVKSKLIQSKLFVYCKKILLNENESFLLKMRVCVLIGKFWENFDDGKMLTTSQYSLVDAVCHLLNDKIAEVRCSACYAIGTFFGLSLQEQYTIPSIPEEETESKENTDEKKINEFHQFLSKAEKEKIELKRKIDIHKVGPILPILTIDCSTMVRREYCLTLYNLIRAYYLRFSPFVLTWSYKQESKSNKRQTSGSKEIGSTDTKNLFPLQDESATEENSGEGDQNRQQTIYPFLWKLLVKLRKDSEPSISIIATNSVNSITSLISSLPRPQKFSRPIKSTFERSNSWNSLLPNNKKIPTIVLPKEVTSNLKTSTDNLVIHEDYGNDEKKDPKKFNSVKKVEKKTIFNFNFNFLKKLSAEEVENKEENTKPSIEVNIKSNQRVTTQLITSPKTPQNKTRPSSPVPNREQTLGVPNESKMFSLKSYFPEWANHYFIDLLEDRSICDTDTEFSSKWEWMQEKIKTTHLKSHKMLLKFSNILPTGFLMLNAPQTPLQRVRKSEDDLSDENLKKNSPISPSYLHSYLSNSGSRNGMSPPNSSRDVYINDMNTFSVEHSPNSRENSPRDLNSHFKISLSNRESISEIEIKEQQVNTQNSNKREAESFDFDPQNIEVQQQNKKEEKKINYKELLKFDEQLAEFDNQNNNSSAVIFDPFETLLYCSHDRNKISVWNWGELSTKRKKVQTIVNHEHKENEKITCLQLLNTHFQTMLLCGTDKGSIKIWKGITNRNSTELISSFTALSCSKKYGLLANWNQKSGKLMVGGEQNFVKLWDLSREISEQEINTGTFSPITSISSALEGDGKLRVASFADGSIKLFDVRVSSNESNSVARQWSEHKKQVVNTHFSKDERFIVSADSDCHVKFWDLRSSISFKTFTSNIGELSCFAAHDFAPIVVCGSKKQRIQVLDTEGNELSVVR